MDSAALALGTQLVTRPVPARPGAGLLGISHGASGSAVTRAFARSPLKLLTPRNHGTGAWVFTSTYGGGLVDGDALTLDVTVGTGATLFLSTQSATKVYRSPHGTSSELTVTIEDGGLFVAVPDPVVCFAGARFHQTQQFHLEGNASMAVIDWMSSGRRAFNERWAFDEYVSRLSVRVDGALTLYDALRLRRDDGDLAERMGRFDVFAIAILAGPALQPEADRIVAAVDARPVSRRPALLVSATALHAGGCLLRVAGPSVEAVGAALRDSLAFLSTILGDDYAARKW